jgi:signal transduction histidine kinase
MPRATDTRSTRGVVWLVDDSILQAQVAVRALESIYEVISFQDGASMLEALAQNEAPDLLVLDWRMPGLSGRELCTFVRRTRDAGELPILILTASETTSDLVQAFEAGANDFLGKPFRIPELMARVSALLHTSHLHAKLAKAEQRLRVEGEFRERFMGMLAHDLRQPLNTFSLANQTIAARVDATLMPLVNMQRRAADRMTRMVSELLDFARSRPESGMPVEREPVDFGALAEALVQEMRVGHPGQPFELAVEGRCEGSWDRDRLAQLCSNLIGNAIEHGAPQATIKVNVRRVAEEVQLAVANEGEAIPADILPTLFEPFRRGRTRGRDGVGLGLHIVSEIARAHGGSVHAESDAARSVFVVRLPVLVG